MERPGSEGNLSIIQVQKPCLGQGYHLLSQVAHGSIKRGLEQVEGGLFALPHAKPVRLYH